MEFELAEEHRMLKDLVANFVRDELMPLEAGVMAREAEGKGLGIGEDDHARLDKRAHDLGLFGLDAPEDVGGSDLPMVAMVGVEEEIGRCITPYTLPPDSPNLRMLMQTGLGTRRIQMAAWSVGMAQRAMEMVLEYAPQRKTFGMPLSERQAIQFWVAEAATKIHATRLMTYDCAWKLDQGRDVRNEISMIKWYATEMAYETVDRAMQAFGAMGMTKELPLSLMQAKLRTMRIYDGPTEVHKWVVARNLLGTRK